MGKSRFSCDFHKFLKNHVFRRLLTCPPRSPNEWEYPCHILIVDNPDGFFISQDYEPVLESWECDGDRREELYAIIDQVNPIDESHWLADFYERAEINQPGLQAPCFLFRATKEHEAILGFDFAIFFEKDDWIDEYLAEYPTAELIRITSERAPCDGWRVQPLKVVSSSE